GISAAIHRGGAEVAVDGAHIVDKRRRLHHTAGRIVDGGPDLRRRADRAFPRHRNAAAIERGNDYAVVVGARRVDGEVADRVPRVVVAENLDVGIGEGDGLGRSDPETAAGERRHIGKRTVRIGNSGAGLHDGAGEVADLEAHRAALVAGDDEVAVAQLIDGAGQTG